MKLKSLPPPVKPSFILSFDFDDTLYDWNSDNKVPASFFELITLWREKYDILWGINTGRDYEFLKEGYEEIARAPFAPDFTITMERYIHLADEHRHLRPLAFWNDKCHGDHQQVFVKNKKDLDDLFIALEETFSGVGWWRQENEAYSIEAELHADLDGIVEHIDGFLTMHSDLSIQRAGPYLRFCHSGYNKGTALNQVALLLGLPEERLCAIGDGHNDMDTLKINGKAFCACPANAVAPLREFIRSRAGYVSELTFFEGTMDALKCFVEPILADCFDNVSK